ncbi:MAG: galactosyltransferase-related protein [Phycisphaerales bacterium]
MTPPAGALRSARGPDNHSRARVHLLIPTHTTRHLALCLAGVAAQTRPPATVVLTCDTDDPAVGEVAAETWARVGESLAGRGLEPPPLVFTCRPHAGEARLNQVRNNGLRALEARGAARDEDLVVVIDGDMLLAPDALGRHARLRDAGYELIIPYRVDLDPDTTTEVSLDSLLGPDAGTAIGRFARPSRLAPLGARDRRYRRQLLLRRLGLTKGHKPKVLGGHHAVSVRLLRAINGYDEGYTGYGYDDDDLSRRLHALRPRVRAAIAVREIVAYHLWHPSRAPARPIDAPGFQRFSRADLPVVAAEGWHSPAPQPAPEAAVIDAGERPSARSL